MAPGRFTRPAASRAPPLHAPRRFTRPAASRALRVVHQVSVVSLLSAISVNELQQDSIESIEQLALVRCCATCTGTTIRINLDLGVGDGLARAPRKWLPASAAKSVPLAGTLPSSRCGLLRLRCLPLCASIGF